MFQTGFVFIGHIISNLENILYVSKMYIIYAVGNAVQFIQFDFLLYIFIYFRDADQSTIGGSIFYEFDEQDDWDEEDPDDDLDI